MDHEQGNDGTHLFKKILSFFKELKKIEFQQYLHNVQCSRMCAMPTNTNIEIDYFKSFYFLFHLSNLVEQFSNEC